MSIRLNTEHLPQSEAPSQYDGPLQETDNYKNGLADAEATLKAISEPAEAVDALATALEARKLVSFASATYDYWTGDVERYARNLPPSNPNDARRH